MSDSTLLIKNGTIVTATDFYVGDVLVEGERISTIGTSLDVPADRVIDAAGKYVLPGGIDVHTHLDMPFGGTTSADDFESGTIAAAHGGTTTIVDFAIQYQGTDAAPRLGNVDEEGGRQGGDRLRVPHDRHRAHRPGRARDGRARPPGRDLVQAVHGLSRRVHAGRRQHLQGAAADGQERRDDLHARRERRRDRRAGEAGARRGQDRAEISRADPPGAGRGGGDAPRHRARRDRRRADLHRAPVRCRGARDGHRSARPGPAGVRGDLSAVPVPVLRQLRRAGIRRRQVRDEPAAAGAGHAGPPVARPRLQRPAGDLHRPLPVLHEGAESARRRGFLEDPQRRTGHRDAHEPRLRRRRPHRPHLAQPLRRADVDVAGEDLRAVPAQGHDRARLRCRHRHLRSGEDDAPVGRDAAHEGRLQPVRRARSGGRHRHGHLARTRHRRRREVHGQAERAAS